MFLMQGEEVVVAREVVAVALVEVRLEEAVG